MFCVRYHSKRFAGHFSIYISDNKCNKSDCASLPKRATVFSLPYFFLTGHVRMELRAWQRETAPPWFAFLSCGVILPICQKRGRENRADGAGTGRGRKRAILAAWRKGRTTRISRFRFRPVATGEGLCGQPAGERQPGGGLPDKRSAGFCADESPK